MSWPEHVRMMNWIDAAIAITGAYALGCLTTGYYLVRALRGSDIRTQGSGSVGARNVGRVLGKTGFLLTTVGDAVKGALAIWSADWLFHDGDIAALALLAVTAGHVWPAQLRFSGGKGVATSLGALCIYDWRLVAVYLLVFATGVAIMRKSVLPGLIAFAGLPVAALWLSRDWFQVIALLLLAALIAYAHRANLLEDIPALTLPRSRR